MNGGNSSNTDLWNRKIVNYNYHQSLRGKFFSTRYKIALLGFLGIGTLFAMRVTMSIAIVAMVTGQDTYDNSFNDNCPVSHSYSKGNSTEKARHVATFDWSTTTQAYILSAPSIGYMFTQIPGAYLSSICGGRIVLGLGILIRAILLLLNPVIAFLGYKWLIVIRVMEGIIEGLTLPAFSHLTARWAPEMERSFFSGFGFSGGFLGITLSYPVIGLLCSAVDSKSSWVLAFAVNGAIGIVWVVFWMYIAYDTPDKHPRISNSEREFINDHTQVGMSRNRYPIPWKKLGIFSLLHKF
ncbi:sialin-like [Convolutriloba macropyga]|uniref:sialin-like n=1 Tax=Convolutriloba macropyga TaxID=536237 RepID=UPI003F5261F1